MDVRANMSSKGHLSMCRIKYLSDKIQLLGILLLLQCVGLEAHRLKRETRCSVYMDPSWQFEDRQCPEGKRYHCYENESDEIVDSGCFHPKDCLKGSHPIVEGETIVCGFCPTGFYQPIDGLKSNEYTFSYCTSHTAPCNPEYGQSLCKAGTRDSDRSCTCNATLGYSPDTNSNTSECQCFTPNSACAECQFTGCPVGSVKTKRGFCEPEQLTTQVVVTSTPKQTISPAGEDNSLSPGATGAIVVSVLLVVAGVIIVLCCWRRKRQRAERVSDGRQNTPQTNGSTNRYQVQYAKNVIINGTVDLEVGSTRNFTLGEHNTINGTSENNNPHPGEVPGSRSNRRSRPELPADTNLSNGQLPSGTTEPGQSLQPQEPSNPSAPSDPSAPADAVSAEGVSKFSPIAANHESAPPLLPTAPDLPQDPSAPPPSILAEDREDADETFVKTILPAAEEATDVETQPKVPYSLYDETDLKKPLLLDHEQKEYKTPIPMGDFGDEMLEDTDLKTLLHKDSGVTSVPPSWERNRLFPGDKVKQPMADVEGDNSIR